MNEFITFGKPAYSDSEISDVSNLMRTGWIGTGSKVKEFEQSFASYLGVEDCLAVNSCTAALHISLVQSQIKPGDEVITTAMTFCSTVNSIVHVGAKPILIDICPRNWNITAEEIEKYITPRTKAILVVHFAGRPCDMISIRELADKFNLIVIEDCAHAIESKISGRHVGTFGDFAAFSFYSTKNISCGEGGVIVTKKGPNILDEMRQLSLHGMDKDAHLRFKKGGNAEYDVKFTGYKYNMMDLQAVIAIGQLKNIDIWHKRRSEIWKYYMGSFLQLPIELPAEINKDVVHAFHLFQILLEKKGEPNKIRQNFRQSMNVEGVGTGIHYKSIPSLTVYKKLFNWDDNDWPNSRYFGNRTVSIPLSQYLTDSEVERVVEAVKVSIKNVQ